MDILMVCNRASERSRLLVKRMKEVLTGQGYFVGLKVDHPDLTIVIGGDGTVLRAVREHPQSSAPLWVINGGHLGYLSESEPEQAMALLDRVLAGDYRLEKRLVLSCVLHSEQGEKSFFALNEAVMYRAACKRTLQTEIAVDGQTLLRFTGDGTMISTATGSTAYNLSAGGPIMMPESEEMLVTPICPHAALSTPLVIPSGSTIEMRLIRAGNEKRDALPHLVVDGDEGIALHAGDWVECRAAAWKVSFVRFGELNFYRRLQQRLGQQR